MLIVLYIAFIYMREKLAYRTERKEWIFELLLATGVLCIAFDGTTAYTVNHLEKIPDVLNRILHAGFLCSLDIMVFLMFVYILDITKGLPKRRIIRRLLELPLFLSIVVVVLFIPALTYQKGEITNYSMGVSAFTCYIMVAVYMSATVALLLAGWKQMGHHKLITIATCVGVSIAVTLYQMFHPEALLSCLVPTFVILGTYLNMENPLFTKLQAHNREMVMGFATLVENRDGSTGGHIRRTTTYVKMLTAEEYEVMKTHAAKGGEIIQETFSHLGDEEYEKIVYEVARHHHEKWNGKGYPDGLSGKEIPLCARIMAVADVFDAVSAKRCYRDAMPLEQCFRIMEEGRGQDFDPVIAEAFLDMKEKVTEVYRRGQQQ